jgi:hypothetical protein
MIRAFDSVLYLVVTGLEGEVTNLCLLVEHDFTLLADFDDLLIGRCGDVDEHQ